MNRQIRVLLIGNSWTPDLPDAIFPNHHLDKSNPDFTLIRHAAELARTFDKLEALHRLPDVIIIGTGNDLDGLDMLAEAQHNQGDDMLSSFVTAQVPITGLWLIKWVQARFQEPPVLVDYHPVFVLFGQRTKQNITHILPHQVTPNSLSEWTKLLEGVEVISLQEGMDLLRLRRMILDGTARLDAE